MHVVFAAGGTAGHVEPALNTADALRGLHPDVNVSFLGGRRGLEGRLVAERGYPLHTVEARPFPRKLGQHSLAFAYHTFRSSRTAASILRNCQADVVVGFGGYVAVPGYLAARRTKTPLVIHEANSVAGFANRLGARWAVRVGATHANVLPRAEPMALPVDPRITRVDRSTDSGCARRRWNLDPDLPVLLVFGGSQGAQHINQVVSQSVKELTAGGVQVLHSVGHNNELPEPVKGYVPLPYLSPMVDAYAAADLVLCRSGAMTCAEVTAVGIPALLVPLPIGNGEQAGNAQVIADKGAAIIRANRELTPKWLVETATSVLRDENRLAQMARKSRALGATDGASQMARCIADIAKGDRA